MIASSIFIPAAIILYVLLKPPSHDMELLHSKSDGA